MENPAFNGGSDHAAGTGCKVDAKFPELIGRELLTPLLPKDFAPPVDLRWPEYVRTTRGEEWWIPTPAAGSGAGEPL